jgi:hypothetical protein
MSNKLPTDHNALFQAFRGEKAQMQGSRDKRRACKKKKKIKVKSDRWN